MSLALPLHSSRVWRRRTPAKWISKPGWVLSLVLPEILRVVQTWGKILKSVPFEIVRNELSNV